MTASINSDRPLDGLRVVSLEHAIAAPFCTRQLADLGADVIKVERPGSGDFARGYDERVKGQSSHFVWTNRSKRSLALDLKSEAAMEILHLLLAETDVFVQNLAPGAAERLGLSYAALSEHYPRLIVCDITGYGNGGPYGQKKAYDLLIQSEAGFLSNTGFPGDDGQAKAGCSIADISAGMYAFTNIQSALLLRTRNHTGSHIEVSMLESMVEWMSYPLYYAYEGAEPPPRTGSSHATIYPYGPFLAGDGKAVLLGLQNSREWEAFCQQVLIQPNLVADPRFTNNSDRSANRETLKAIIVEAFSSLTASDVAERLDVAGIANARVNDMHDVWAHPQLKARGRWVSVDSPSGEIPALLPPGDNNKYTPAMAGVPGLGEHSRAILMDLGFSVETITDLMQSGVLGDEIV